MKQGFDNPGSTVLIPLLFLVLALLILLQSSPVYPDTFVPDISCPDYEYPDYR